MTRASVLRFFGPDDPDHLDPLSQYHMRPGQLARAVSRTLFAFPVTEGSRRSGVAADVDERFIPIPDAAVRVPTRANGGVSADRLTYTVELRGGLLWDSEPPRPVTAADFVRGIRRVVALPPDNAVRACLEEVVAGLRRYGQAWHDAGPGPGGQEEFEREHPVAGLRAENDATVVITVDQPANDLLSLLASGFTAAVPARDERLSCGPYRLVRSGPAELLLTPNPHWRKENDPIRDRGADRVVIRDIRADPALARAWTAGGLVSPAWPFGVVSWREMADRRVPDDYPGYTPNPYLVLNLRNGPLQDLRVRKALAYAVDKAALAGVFGAVAGVHVRPLRSMLAPGSIGATAFDPYPTPGDRGDPGRARTLLAEAGYPAGLSLVAAVRDTDLHRTVIGVLAESAARSGIRFNLRRYSPGAFYRDLLFEPARAAEWDLAAPGWTPEWHGNNGRATFAQLFRPGPANYGGYVSFRLDAMIARALSEESVARAALLWHQADVMVMKDLPVVPLLAFACRCCAARSGATGLVPRT